MTPYTYIRNCWYAAGLAHEFAPEVLTAHRIAEKPIVVWRTNAGKAVAFDDRCCHKRFPMSQGRFLEDGILECAYHGLCYDESGRCVAIPSAPGRPIPAKARLRPVPVIEQDGVVWVWPGDPELAESRRPPRTPEIGSDDWQTVDSGPMQTPANYLLLIENLLDVSHFYPLHEGNIGDKENSLIPVNLEEGEVDGNEFVRTIREVQNYKQPPFLVDWFGYDVIDRRHTHCMASPGLTHVVMQLAPPGELGTDRDRGYVLYHTHTPVNDGNHVWRWIVNFKKEHTSAGDSNVPLTERFSEMFPTVVAEDLWALEKQQEMIEFGDEGHQELFLKPDMGLRRARQVFMRMLREERPEYASAGGARTARE